MSRYLVKQKVVQWNVSEVVADCITNAVWIAAMKPSTFCVVEKREEPTEVIVTLIEEKK